MAFNKTNNIAIGGKIRQSNLELCRILAILLVVLVHANFAWCGWPSNFSECNFARLLIEGFAIIGVNVFVLITGYFLLKLFADTGKDMVNALNHLVYSYNNPVVILSSISFFCFFKNIEIGYSKFINYIAGSVLAVLLIHTSAPLNPFMKEYFRVSLENYSGISLVIIWILGLVSIFFFCVVVDQLRIFSYRLIKTKINIFTDTK